MFFCVRLQQFRGGRSDYSVRTDDGESICAYIEEFQKNPEKALVCPCEEGGTKVS